MRKDRPDRERVERIFEAILDAPAEGRAAHLEEACGGDAALRSEVEALLRAHERPDGLLDRELVENVASLLHDRRLSDRRSVARAVPDRVDRYRIVHEIGRGGMGVVYLAERADGHFRSRVALKVIRTDGDPDLPARLIAERQILASLDHPNIAKLVDGGVTDDGRPYLVMEYVAGLPIDVYCDRMRLPVRERLALFLTVVRAVQHAHQNLIVHRDLKPSNVLVTAEGKVKLLDFGIAKLLDPALASVHAPVTRTERRVMTPEFASPEQLRGEVLTTASDVYSLGIVLYLLLTGHAPYRVRRADASALLSAVLEQDPERPSSLATKPAQRTEADGRTREVTASELAADRGATPDRLRRALRGDLDAILMKALRKEPANRYASAELLAQDIDAYLTGLPVQAHRGSRWYRAQKLVRRHRAEAIAAALVVVSLVTGAGAAVWQAGIAEEERDRAEAARVGAELAAAESNEVAGFLFDLFQSGDPLADSNDVTARDLLRRGAERADALGNQPVVQARMLDVIGRMHHRLGLLEDAERLLDRAIALRRQHLGPQHVDVAESLIHRSLVYRSRARQQDARRLLEQALAIRQRALPPDDPAIAEVITELGWLARDTAQERLYRRALEIYRAAGAQPERQVGVLQGLATNLRRQGRLDEAYETDRAAMEFASATFGPDHPTTAYAMIHFGDQVRDIGRDPDGAIRLFRRGLELQERHFGRNSVMLVHGLNSLAWTLSRGEQHAEAEAIRRRVLDIQRSATGPEHTSVAHSQLGLAEQLVRSGKPDEAEPLVRSSMALFERLLGRNHPAYSNAVRALALVADARGDGAEAERLLRQALAIRLESDPSEIIVGESRREIGRLLTRLGRYPEAEAELLASLHFMRDRLGAEHPNVVESKRALFGLYAAWRRPAEAEKYRVPDGEFVAY